MSILVVMVVAKHLLEALAVIVIAERDVDRNLDLCDHLLQHVVGENVTVIGKVSGEEAKVEIRMLLIHTLHRFQEARFGIQPMGHFRLAQPDEDRSSQ